MRISTEIYAIAEIIGEEKSIEAVARAGFDAWDFSMFDMCGFDWERQLAVPTGHVLSGPDYLAFARRLKQIGLDNGIVCNQSHAPFPTHCPQIQSFYQRAIECTAEAGGQICVIHPDNHSGADRNAEMYHELLPFAKACGVKIATENMFNWDNTKDEPLFAACATEESFLEHITAVNDPFLVACVDVGHAEMRPVGPGAANLIHALGSHVQALHLHDNDLRHDAHQIPFTMNIDYRPIVQALKDVGYQGDLTLEASNCLQGYAADQVAARVAEMAESARRLAAMFEA